MGQDAGEGGLTFILSVGEGGLRLIFSSEKGGAT